MPPLSEYRNAVYAFDIAKNEMCKSIVLRYLCNYYRLRTIRNY